jgi:hypothetical protein
MKEALKLSRYKTKKDLIHKALEEFIQNRKRRDLRELKGKVNFDEKYNHKESRSR